MTSPSMTEHCPRAPTLDHAVSAADKEGGIGALLKAANRCTGNNENAADDSLPEAFHTVSCAGEGAPSWTCESSVCKLRSEVVVNPFRRIRCSVCHSRRGAQDRESVEEQVRAAETQRALKALSGSRLKARRSLAPLVEVLIGLGVRTYYVTYYRSTRLTKGKDRFVHHYRSGDRWQHFNSVPNVAIFALEHSGDDDVRSRMKEAVSVAISQMGEHLQLHQKLKQALERQ